MKKPLIAILLSLLFLTGCGEVLNTFDVDDKDIISLRLNNELITSDKYADIDRILEKINFSSKKIKTPDENFSELVIRTDTESYLMKIFNNETISFLDIDNKMYYATDKNSITALIAAINTHKETNDSDISFASIDYIEEYEDKDEDAMIVDLEPTLEAYKLLFNDDIDNFTIYSTSYNDDILNKKDVLYEKNSITKNQTLIIKTNTSESVPKILIYITRGENTEVITPKYDYIERKIKFDSRIEKNNS